MYIKQYTQCKTNNTSEQFKEIQKRLKDVKKKVI